MGNERYRNCKCHRWNNQAFNKHRLIAWELSKSIFTTIGPHCNRKTDGCFYFHFSIRGSSLSWLFTQSPTLSVRSLDFITPFPLLSIPHLVSLTRAKSEPLPPLDVSESLSELRDMICSYYEDSSLSVCSLPLFLPTSAIQNGFGFVVSTGCLACEPLEAGQLKLLLPRPHEPHLGVPPLCAHISLLFTPANPDPGHFLLPRILLPFSHLLILKTWLPSPFLVSSKTSVSSGKYSQQCTAPWECQLVQNRGQGIAVLLPLFSLDRSQGADKGIIVTLSQYERKWSHFTQLSWMSSVQKKPALSKERQWEPVGYLS